MIFYIIIVFIFGLVVGSFLNVVILRGNRGESFTRGRSRCESCGKELAWFELIPLLSFALQRGRCRSCGAALSRQYPLVEFGTGLFFTFVAIYYSPSGVEGLPLWSNPRLVFELTFAFVTLSAAIVILVSDIRWQIVPNGPVLILFLAGLVLTAWRAAVSGRFAYNFAIEFGFAFLVAFFFFALWFLSKGAWMGFGDVKLVFATSLILGFPVSVAAALFSFWIGAIFGILLLIFKKANLKTHIPFGPFILLGGVAAFFYTEEFLLYTGFSGLL